ncbi:glycosyltransferase [Lysinibacillus sp. NPDC096212]|uniref:glycosyltransferase n=1 Tax=Lysinibacillus sp. NPDC096212 TaxID=3364135 RepID=UPI00382DFD56
MESISVSAVIPAYNAELYIEKAIRSLLNQTIHIDEIIIVDDGSVDCTCEIVEEIQREQSKVFLYKQVNAGASAARNKGISKAKGNWILPLDADDECSEQLVENYIGKIQNGDYAAVYTNFVQINETSEVISGIFSGYELRGNDGFCKMLIRNPIISPSGSMIKKTIYEEINGFDINVKYVEDVDFWLRLLANDFNIGHIEKPLISIRRHATNTTASIEITKAGEKILLDKYSISNIKEKIYKREYSIEDNHLDFANLLIRYEKWLEADEVLKANQVDKNNNRYISFLFIKSIVALHFKKLHLAKEYYFEILESNRQHGAAMNNLAVLYSLENQFSSAKELLSKVLEININYLDAHHNLMILSKDFIEYEELKFTWRELRPNLLHYQ